MYCFELVFGVEDKDDKSLSKDHSESIVVSEDMQVLEYAKKRLETFPDDELIAIVRRNPIIDIIKKEEK